MDEKTVRISRYEFMDSGSSSIRDYVETLALVKELKEKGIDFETRIIEEFDTYYYRVTFKAAFLPEDWTWASGTVVEPEAEEKENE